MSPFRDRPTSDLLILMVALTICLSILGLGAGLVVVALADPGRDLGAAAQALGQILALLLGLLAGYFIGAGRPRQ